MPGYNANHTARPPSAGLFAYQHILDGLLDLIFPPRCANCGLVDARWCGECAEELAACSISLYTREIDGIIEVASTGSHSGVLQQADLALKYENAVFLSEPLGRRLSSVLSMLNWEIDLVAPVPMHVNRQQMRGYNQAALLAVEVAAAHDIRFSDDALIRFRDTPTQVGLGVDARRLNVSDAFRADAAQLEGKRLLLVDDVCTSGATLAACARAAYEAGATTVHGITVTAARENL